MRNRFPFVVKPVQTPESFFHIESLLNEPRSYINASSANCWIYRDGSNITRFLVAGHGNAAVCKQVSSLIFSTFLNLKDIDEGLMVPGACLLKGGPIFSGFDSQVNNLKSTRKLTFEQLSSIISLKHEPLKELARETVRLQGETGLVFVTEAKEIDYQKMQKRLLNWIEEYLKNKKDTLLCSEKNGSQSNAIFLPFYALNENKPKALSFELNINLFMDEDFYNLNKIHLHSIILEMTRDASRRKRIYKDWLLNDQEKHKNFGLTYEKMSTEKRTAKSIVITGLRNYIEATTGSPEKEICVSPQEMYERNLPSLIKEDKNWIDRMEQLIKDIEERDKERDKRMDSINLATLIDSFLRGWPSIFLEGEEAKQSYEKWCDNKRKRVWKVIHKELLRQGIRMDPLLAENTVFQVRNINNKSLLVTPLHLIDSNEFLILLSKKYGLTYYVDLWERRKLVFAEKTPGETNQEKSNYFYNEGTHALSNNDRSKALELFKRALQFHPVYASSEIFKGWWQQFSKDTLEDFNKYNDLFRGITAFTKGSYQESIEYLKSFVKVYPDYLADPYLMISFRENQIRSGFFQKIKKHQQLINEYEKVRESHRIRHEALESNRKLFELIIKFNNTHGPKKDEIGYHIAHNYEHSRVEEVMGISNELTKLQKQLKSLENHIKSIRTEIEKISKEVWHELKKQEDLYIKKALELDFNYVNKIFTQEKLELSDTYWTKFRASHEIFKGDEYIHIAYVLNRLSSLKDLERALFEIKSQVDRCLEVEYLQEEDLTSLKEFKKKIDSFSKMDSITRELIFRKDVYEIAQDYFQKGLNLYHDSLGLLPQFVEPFKKLTHIISFFWPQYRKALEAMTSTKISLRNFSPRGTFEVLDKSNYNVIAVRIDRSKNLMKTKDDDGNEISSIRFSNLSDIEIAHLEGIVSQEWFLQDLSPFGSNTAEQILNTYIPVSPLSGEWSKLLKELEGGLIKIMGYAHISPVPTHDQMDEKRFDIFEELSVVERVEVNFQDIQQEFLDEVGLERSSISVRKV